MERRFHVLFTGRLHAGFRPDDIVERLVPLFQIDRPKAADLLSSGRPIILKRGLSWEQAQKVSAHLERIGLRMKIIEADADRQRSSPPVSGPVPSGPANKIQAPINRPACSASHPSKKPGSAAACPADPAIDERPPTGDRPPFRVEGSHGWLWINEAFGLFFRQPLKWTTLMFVFYLIILPLAAFHFPKSLSIAVLAPVLLGGIILGAQCQQEGGQVRIGHLFQGFASNLTQLLLIGLAHLALLAALAFITVLSISRIAFPVMNPYPLLTRDFPSYLTSLAGFTVLAVLLLMGCWFAPCLVALDRASAFTGFRLSFKAVRINSRPLMINGLAFLLLGIFTVFFYGATAALCSFLLGPNHIFLSMLVPMLSTILLVLPLSALLPLSIYSSYKDIFHGIPQSATDG